MQKIISELEKENFDLKRALLESPLKDDPNYAALYKIYESALKNMNINVHAKRYNDDALDICLLFYLLGKETYLLCEKLFHFPSLETMRKYRIKKMQMLFGENADNPNLFNGSPENIHSLIDALFPKDCTDEQKKVVLAIDAASVRANITVEQSGQVTGLTDKDFRISPQEAQELINSETKFKQFCAYHFDKATQAIFAVLFVPLDPDLDTFPICEIAAKSGSATEEILDQLKIIKTIVEDDGIHVVGFGCDGDPQYLDDAKVFLQYCLKNFAANFNGSIIDNFNQILFEVIFYDTLHLGKNNRYYYSADSKMFIWVNPQADTFSREDLIKAGINAAYLPQHDNKMDDNLALKVFTFENIRECIRRNK